MIKKIVRNIRRLIPRVIAMLGSARICYSCKKSIGRFLPYRNGWKDVPESMIALDVIGSDAENFMCPRCGSHDRERHLLMYFDAKNVWGKIDGGAILHFAPERRLSKEIKLRNPRLYIQADLYPSSSAIEKHDITRLDFSDHAFDIVIANHILEHVQDDFSAMSEIIRVLKPGGLAILQTPYSAVLQHCFQDVSIVTDAARLEAYGQEDHVRLYGRDLFEKLENAGFTSLVCSHEQALPTFSPALYGVNAREPFMCFQRPE